MGEGGREEAGKGRCQEEQDEENDEPKRKPTEDRKESHDVRTSTFPLPHEKEGEMLKLKKQA